MTMMKSILVFAILLATVANAEEIAPTPYPVSYSIVDSVAVPGIPEEYKHFRWHRFETPNFEVLAINRHQAIGLLNRCEPLKTWAQRRWGLQDVVYNRKCMVLCVPTQEIFKKWFRRPDVDPKVAKSKNVDGSDREVYAIWLAGEQGYLENKLPEKIGRVNLLNYEATYNISIGHWAHVGMSALNNHVNEVRRLLGSLDPKDSYKSKAVFKQTTQRVMGRLNNQEYRARAAVLCLMLRKQQYGGEKFIWFLSTMASSGPDQALATVYGWQGCAGFDVSYTRYVQNLVYDIRVGRTPNMGLTWFVPKKDRQSSK